MNENIITTLAALKTFYDSGNDLIGVFSNIILLVFSKEQTHSIDSIQKNFFEKTKLNIPIDVLQTIIKRLRKENSVIYDNLRDSSFQSIKITEGGKTRRDKIRDDYINANREKNALIQSICDFSKQKGFSFSIEEMERELNNFIELNFSYAVSSLEKKSISLNENLNVHHFIADYFNKSERLDPVNFKRIKSILYGKIISIAFLNRRFEQKSKLEKLSIYLDTNIIFSLFGFHDDFYNNSAKEVANMMLESGCKLKIFSFTKDEIVYKLGGYLREYGYYSSEIRVNSIYYTLKQKNYSKTDVISFIENIEEKLDEIGIEIDYTFDLDDLLQGEEEHISKLNSYKTNSHVPSVRYDLAVIFAIQKIRGGKKFYSWEKSCAIFLSADRQLVLYDFEEHEHKTLFTIPEVIFRSDMASMFWLKGKSGSDNVFIHNFLTNYMRETIISTNLWNKFIDAIKNKLNNGEINQEQVEEIISLSETGKILREKGESGIMEVLNDSHIQEIKEKSIEKDNSIRENEQTIILQNNQLSKVNEVITKDCRNFWGYFINIFVWAITIILYFLVLFSILKFGLPLVANILQLFFLVSILTIAISVTVKKKFEFLRFIINKRNNFENKMVNKCIIKKKKSFGINIKEF